MTDRQAGRRRYAVIASVFVIVLLIVIFASLFDTCGGMNEAQERIAPTEEGAPAPAPGVQ